MAEEYRFRRLTRVPAVEVRVTIHPRPGGKFCAKLTEVNQKFDTMTTDQPTEAKARWAAQQIASYRRWLIV